MTDWGLPLTFILIHAVCAVTRPAIITGAVIGAIRIVTCCLHVAIIEAFISAFVYVYEGKIKRIQVYQGLPKLYSKEITKQIQASDLDS